MNNKGGINNEVYKTRKCGYLIIIIIIISLNEREKRFKTAFFIFDRRF
jgi:hypothetical protein